jgi:hypothetical protein
VELFASPTIFKPVMLFVKQFDECLRAILSEWRTHAKKTAENAGQTA